MANPAAQRRDSQLCGYRFSAMACENELQLYASQEKANDAARIVIETVKRIEHKFSRYREDSIVSRINQAAGEEFVAVDEETERLLEYADTCFAESGGRFDITSGILRRAWDFKTAKVPAADKIAELLALIGWQYVERRPRKVRLARPGMQIDLGGIGKEYAVDCAAAALMNIGIEHALINLGGDVRVLGPHADGRPWLIGIRNPRNPGKTIETLALSRGALATSGDYERFFEADGKRYCHILNPKSGWPVQDLQAVSILAPSCLVAGSIATICMLLGEAGSLAYLKQNAVHALIVRSDGNLVKL